LRWQKSGEGWCAGNLGPWPSRAAAVMRCSDSAPLSGLRLEAISAPAAACVESARRTCVLMFQRHVAQSVAGRSRLKENLAGGRSTAKTSARKAACAMRSPGPGTARQACVPAFSAKNWFCRTGLVLEKREGQSVATGRQAPPGATNGLAGKQVFPSTELRRVEVGAQGAPHTIGEAEWAGAALDSTRLAASGLAPTVWSVPMVLEPCWAKEFRASGRNPRAGLFKPQGFDNMRRWREFG